MSNPDKCYLLCSHDPLRNQFVLEQVLYSDDIENCGNFSVKSIGGVDLNKGKDYIQAVSSVNLNVLATFHSVSINELIAFGNVSDGWKHVTPEICLIKVTQGPVKYVFVFDDNVSDTEASGFIAKCALSETEWESFKKSDLSNQEIKSNCYVCRINVGQKELKKFNFGCFKNQIGYVLEDGRYFSSIVDNPLVFSRTNVEIVPYSLNCSGYNNGVVNDKWPTSKPWKA